MDTFLLPSLVPAIRFLSDYLCNDEPQEQKAVLRILQLLLTPTAISTEASTMLTSVLNLVAKPLEHSLRAYQRRDPKNVQIEPLLRVLKDSLPLSRRTVGAEHNEMESWSSTPGGGLTAAIKNTVQSLVHWSLRPDMNVMPTPYTHRQMLAGTKALGAKLMLRIILEEVQVQSSEGNAAVVLDVATALLCAPDPAHDAQAGAMQGLDEAGNVPPAPERQASLREALKEAAEGFRKMQKRDPALAEAAVRLHRRVQEQMAPSQAQMLPAELAAPLDDSTVQAAAAAQGDAMQMDGVGLDLMAGVSGGDLNLGSGGGGSFDLGDDIWGSLDGAGDTFDWDAMGDSMDLT